MARSQVSKYCGSAGCAGCADWHPSLVSLCYLDWPEQAVELMFRCNIPLHTVDICGWLRNPAAG